MKRRAAAESTEHDEDSQRSHETLLGWLPYRGVDGSSKGSGSGFGDSLVLFAAPAADADGAYYLAGPP